MRHNLHGQCEGVHFFTLLLKMFTFSDSFISSGTRSQILGPRKDSDSMPWYTELTWRLVKNYYCNVDYMGQIFPEIFLSQYWVTGC